MVDLSSAQQVRREKMLDAGQEIILRNGYRGTTMEAVAAEAGVAKPTLYKYFPDKDALYNALIARLTEQVRAVFDRALMQEGSEADRITAALTAKKKYVFRLLQASPHAEELGGDEMNSHLSAVRELEKYTEDAVHNVLEPKYGSDARYLTQLILACVYGISKHATYVEQIGPAIRLVVRRLLV